MQEASDIKITSYFLEECIVGANWAIDFSLDNQRLCYLVDYEQMKVVPPLHRNLIHFMGMEKRSNYLCTKRDMDIFIALNKSGLLSCWNIVNGKLVSRKKVTNVDLENYEIY